MSNALNNDGENGIINIEIDEFVPCLRDLKTGQLLDTNVSQISRKELKGYNKKTGWYINWQKVPYSKEIYAVRINGQEEIQGLVAFEENKEAQAIEGHWVVANPKSNKQLTDNPEYSGIGGHLFAIMAAESQKRGYDGFVVGEAANLKLLEYYLSDDLKGKPLGGRRFYLDEDASNHLLEKYNWTEK